MTADNINQSLWESYPRDKKVIISLMGLTKLEALRQGKDSALVYRPTEGCIGTLSKEIAYLTVIPQSDNTFSCLDLLGDPNMDWKLVLHTPEGEFIRDYNNLKEVVTMQIQGLLELELITEEIASQKLMQLHGGIEKIFHIKVGGTRS